MIHKHWFIFHENVNWFWVNRLTSFSVKPFERALAHSCFLGISKISLSYVYQQDPWFRRIVCPKNGNHIYWLPQNWRPDRQSWVGPPLGLTTLFSSTWIELYQTNTTSKKSQMGTAFSLGGGGVVILGVSRFFLKTELKKNLGFKRKDCLCFCWFSSYAPFQCPTCMY